MVRIFLISTLMLFASLVAAAMTDEISLNVGQHKTADRGRISIKFVSVLEDSRCPANARCIWAGNAKIKLAVSKGKSPEKIVTLNTGLDPRVVSIYGYQLEIVGLTQHIPGAKKRPLRATISVKK